MLRKHALLLLGHLADAVRVFLDIEVSLHLLLQLVLPVALLGNLERVAVQEVGESFAVECVVVGDVELAVFVSDCVTM